MKIVNKIYLLITGVVWIALGHETYAYDQDSLLFSINSGEAVHRSAPEFVTRLTKVQKMNNLYIGGYYRAYLYHRKMDQAYTGHTTNRHLSVGDGYREPMLLLFLGGNPTPSTNFGTQIFILPDYRGIGYENTDLNVQLGVMLYGDIKTNFGKFNIQAGGINWARLSHFTLWQNETYGRFSIFDRTPWEDAGNVAERYKGFYNRGTINQDARWGRRAFQGLYIEGNGLPNGLSTVLMYGKTDNNGGVSSFLDNKFPNQLYAGKLKKSFRKNYIALNTFNSIATTDSVNGERKGYNIHTVEYLFKIKEFKLGGEAGLGSYGSPTYQRGWSEGINVRLFSPGKYSGIPLDLQFYQMGKNFVNLNGVMFNTSVGEARQTGVNLANSQSIFPFSSPVTEIGQLANNRRGLNLNSEFKIWKLRFNVGYGNASELEKLSNKISYNHRVNGLAFSRLSLFMGGIGPYRRVNTFFRGYFEELTLADTTAEGRPLYNKYFNDLETQVKYKTKLLGREFFAYYLASFNSVGNKFSMIPDFSDPYLKIVSNEFECYYALFPKLLLSGYYGIERAIANDRTDANTYNRDPLKDPPSYKHRNQTGQGYGFGFDIAIGENAGLYFRQRWFSFRDKNFADDHFRGQEATVELKVMFY